MRCRRVGPRMGEGLKPRVLLADPVEDQQEVARRSRQPVKVGYDYKVFRPDAAQKLFKLRPVRSRAARYFLEHSDSTGRTQSPHLCGEVLGVGRYSGVTKNHSPILAAINATEKPKRNNRPIFVQML